MRDASSTWPEPELIRTVGAGILGSLAVNGMEVEPGDILLGATPRLRQRSNLGGDRRERSSILAMLPLDALEATEEGLQHFPVGAARSRGGAVLG